MARKGLIAGLTAVGSALGAACLVGDPLRTRENVDDIALSDKAPTFS
jgi:hypothetical protein